MTIDKVAPVAQSGDSPRGFGFALAAYFLWGFLPIYMKAVAHISPAEVIAHRIFWSLPVAGLILVVLGRTSEVKTALRTPRMVMMAGVTALLITFNWGIYVWAIGAGRALDTALGYFINPLFSIFLAAVLLKEKLQPLQIAAIAISALGVAVLTYKTGSLPWVSIALTVSWGFYAFFRKALPIGPNQGFLLEVLLLAIPSLGYIIYLEVTGTGHLLHGTATDTALLAGSGIITAVPLMLYANGAKLLRLSTIGIMQYIAPTMIFIIAVFFFKEPFGSEKLIAFCLIWLALAVYSWSLIQQHRGR
jgi:chloramphenicol-sensitive protein RarD